MTRRQLRWVQSMVFHKFLSMYLFSNDLITLSEMYFLKIIDLTLCKNHLKYNKFKNITLKVYQNLLKVKLEIKLQLYISLFYAKIPVTITSTFWRQNSFHYHQDSCQCPTTNGCNHC